MEFSNREGKFPTLPYDYKKCPECQYTQTACMKECINCKSNIIDVESWFGYPDGEKLVE
jgi:hypothetical protein